MILEWVKCLINPQRETDLRISVRTEEILLRGLDCVLFSLFVANFYVWGIVLIKVVRLLFIPWVYGIN
jgi:hypothetical protein